VKFGAHPAEVTDIRPYKDLYRQQAGCQIIHYTSIDRGFTQPYLIEANGRRAGYGAMFTKHYEPRIMEFYLFPEFVTHATEAFEAMLTASKAVEIEAQTNMPLANSMLEQYAVDIEDEARLFAVSHTTSNEIPGAVFRKRQSTDRFQNGSEPEGDWVVEWDSEIVANGGFLTHYNPPYADFYMETAAPFRQKGFGKFLIQELKRVCYEAGRLPAARCNPDNEASHRTLLAAGFQQVGLLRSGRVKPKG
jgi:RimJ/RimL family protein N-acetyltransferase